MDKAIFSRFTLAGAMMLTATVFLSGCAKNTAKEPSESKVSEAELRAFCPPIQTEEGSAYFNTYTRGGEGKAEKVIYQAAIRNATRSCHFPGGMMTMEVAAAGRVVPGPQFKAGTVTMPIYVRVTEGANVLYSKTQKYSVSINNNGEATQFIFKDDKVSFPQPSGRGVKVFVGFDIKDKGK